MPPTRTDLAPGQRYAQPGAGRLAQPVTIIRLVSDPFGLPRVVFEHPGGREVVAFVAQVEAAIADGQLTPIAGPGVIERCEGSVAAAAPSATGHRRGAGRRTNDRLRDAQRDCHKSPYPPGISRQLVSCQAEIDEMDVRETDFGANFAKG